MANPAIPSGPIYNASTPKIIDRIIWIISTIIKDSSIRKLICFLSSNERFWYSFKKIKLDTPKSVKIHPKGIPKTHIPMGYAKYQYSVLKSNKVKKVRVPNFRFVSPKEISVLSSVVKESHFFRSLISLEVLATCSFTGIGFPLESNFLHLKSHSDGTVVARRVFTSYFWDALNRK